MKKIIFRVWDTLRNEMTYPENKEHNYSGNNIPKNGGLGYYLVTQKGVLLCNDGIVMDDWHNKFIINLFTGLKDKNSKKIYEGDIIKWGHLKHSQENTIRIAEVKMNPDIQFDCKNIEHPHIFHFGKFAYGGAQTEIIGNIYQNPELLTP